MTCKVETLTNEDTFVIRLTGRFDFNVHRDFRSSYEKALGDAEIRHVDIDLGGVEYIDSSALGMLLLLRERASKSDKDVRLTHCRDFVKDVLGVVNFDSLFTVN